MPLEARSRRRSMILNTLALGFAALAPTAVHAQPPVLTPRVTLADTARLDQDDMCVWIHPTDRSLSTIIAADKTADKLFVYDLLGNTLQVLPIVGMPGNVDIRYNQVLGADTTDIVGFNDRVNNKIQVFSVDAETRQLSRVDAGAIGLGPNYGFCLYRSRISAALYAFTTAQNGVIAQYELSDVGGQVQATPVRSWDIGKRTEGCVCDDETGFAYFGEESLGVWKVGAEPSDPTAGSLIASVGDASGLIAEVEGLTIYYRANGEGYLLVSCQGNSSFKVYNRVPPHEYIKTFTVQGVTFTDGIDVINLDLGPEFPFGLIAVHNHRPAKKTVEVCAYEDVGLMIDTEYWNPRNLNDNTATQVSLQSVQAEPGSVRLAWFATDDRGFVATVYRRSAETDWLELGEVSPDGSGRLFFEDQGVEAGGRYGYRLGIPSGQAEEYFGEVWVDVPTMYRLALLGARPNPVARELMVSFSLPDAQPATIEIYDPAGRRRLWRRVDGLGPGSHVLNLGETPASSAGLYLIRLTQGSRSLTRKAVVVR